MNLYKASVIWERNGEPFTDQAYSRKHNWEFDGGLSIPASASPEVVDTRYTDPSAVDPEEAFVASICSCHMLWFLSIAAHNGFVVESYTDHAEGKMEKNAEGKLAITAVLLKPEVAFRQPLPGKRQFIHWHRQAHKKCFIAQSVKTEITIDANIVGSS